MLKRLLLLGFLCAAFLLLMSLMISSAAEDTPAPRIIWGAETAFFPVKDDSCRRSDNTGYPHTAFRLPAPAAPLVMSTAYAFLMPRSGGPYFQVFYHAFHFSDRAG